MKVKIILFSLLFLFVSSIPSYSQGTKKDKKIISKKPRIIIADRKRRVKRGRTNSVSLMRKFMGKFRIGTNGVRLRNIPNLSKKVENSINLDELEVRENELPKDLIYTRVPKFPENPALLRDDRDLKRVSREAFDMELYWRYWNGANITLMTDGLNESIYYYVIAIEFKSRRLGPIEKSEIEHLKEYMKKTVGDEAIILEKYPFIIVIASDFQGEEQFKNVKLLGDILKKKINPECKKDGDRVGNRTKEVSLTENTKFTTKKTEEIKLEKQNIMGKKKDGK
jgi:hypothetical protein